MPIWVEEKLDQVISKYSALPFDENTFPSLRNELSELGLERLMPDAIKRVVD